LTFEHEEDVEIVVLFDATFLLRLDDGGDGLAAAACLLGSRLRGRRRRSGASASVRRRIMLGNHDRIVLVVMDRN
jgi:hypothetical protein